MRQTLFQKFYKKSIVFLENFVDFAWILLLKLELEKVAARSLERLNST